MDSEVKHDYASVPTLDYKWDTKRYLVELSIDAALFVGIGATCFLVLKTLGLM